MLPNPGKKRTCATFVFTSELATPPAASVGSWNFGSNAMPRSMLLRLTVACPFQLCWPVYEKSMALEYGSATCVPTFHWNDVGRLLSYWNTVSDGGAFVVNPAAPMSCNRP